MRHNRSRFRVGTWRAALLMTLALSGASVTRAGATIGAEQDPTQSSTQTFEILAPDSRPAQGPLAPGTPELVAALPPFTIQHFPPALLLSAPNPANGEDAVQEADKCAEDVPVTPDLVPLPRNSFDAAQDVVQTAEEQFKCLEDIEQQEAKETDTINVDTQSELTDIATDEPVAEDPTQGVEQEEVPVPPEVEAAAQEAEAANQEEVVDPGQESGPVFTPIVPEGPGCPEVQEEVLDLRTGFVSVEAELRVVEVILQECEQSPTARGTPTAQPPSPTATSTAQRAAHTATSRAQRAAHTATLSSHSAAHHAGHHAQRSAAHHAGHHAQRSAAHHAGHHAGLQVQ